MIAFKEDYESLHPRNRLIIHTEPSPTGRERYVSSTFIIGPAVELADHEFSTRQFELDGAHFKKKKFSAKIPGLTKALIMTDANNTSILLAISHESREESTETWRVFLHDAIDCVAHIMGEETGICSDRDVGILHVSPETSAT